MLTRTPAISVVMPVHNGGRYLSEAVDSVLTQDFRDFEFVIIDDGSTDDSLQRLEDYAAGDSRIRLVSRANTGIVGALNDGLEISRGQFVARMDADDIALPRRLGRQYKHLTNNEQCVAVGSRILLIDSAGWPLCEMCYETTHQEIDSANLRGGGAAMNHPSVMFRTDAVRALGGYRQEMIYAEDLDLWLRLAEVGELYNLPQVLVHYRMHAKSISHARSQEQHRKWRLAAREALERRGKAEAEIAHGDGAKETASTEGDHHIRWAWWALMAGNVGTARKHALAGLRRHPLSLESWRVTCCAIRGH